MKNNSKIKALPCRQAGQTQNSDLRLQSGFTLIEVIISLSIFAILLSLTLFSYGDYRKKSALKLGAEQIRSALDECQNRALAPEPKAGQIPKDYLLHISTASNYKNKIHLQFISTTNNYVELTPGVIPDNLPSLPNKVEFYSINPNGSGGEIKFEVPQTIPDGKKITFDGYAPSAINSGQPDEGIGKIELTYNDELYIIITLNCYTGEMNIGQIDNTP